MTDYIIVSQADAAVLRMMPLNEPLRRELARAIVVSSEAMPPDVVTMNSLVRYRDELKGVTRTVALVYPYAAQGGQGMVSVLSPIGTALLGLSEGQTIDWDFPDGSHRRLRVEEVLHQPERIGNRPDSPNREI
jgi:regulator of nucleoside diphosphate kinase